MREGLAVSPMSAERRGQSFREQPAGRAHRYHVDGTREWGSIWLGALQHLVKQKLPSNSPRGKEEKAAGQGKGMIWAAPPDDGGLAL